MMEEEQPQRLILDPSEALEDSDADSDAENAPPADRPGRVRAPRPSALNHRQSLAVATKRRRRSSSRFLRRRLSVASTGGASLAPSEQHLGELYRKAIRMNAENRINAQNSWNLPLIEHIDKFLEEEEDEEEAEAVLQEVDDNTQNTKPGKRVNFTKASCTLDASIKIFSFRVDDVHLTSYKVLANLNRNQKPGEKDDDDLVLPADPAGGDHDDRSPQKSRRKDARVVQTLETNRANINMNRLDSAFDIDPLFHKMSKTFDEGGAKGLLLANLQTKNCSIVFDSSEVEESQVVGESEPQSVDITSLRAKLESNLAEQPLESLPLVPQLASLRAEYETLRSQGFVVAETAPRTRRFQPSADEEELADKSIHQDALERSFRTPAKSIIRDTDGDEADDMDGGPVLFNITPQGSFGKDQFAVDDFGAGDDDDDYDFAAFMAQEGTRYSNIGSGTEDTSNGNPFADDGPSPTAVLLDSLSKTNFLSQSNYSYFNERALSRIENMWAGATHWKPIRKYARSQPTEEVAKKKKATASRKKAAKDRSFVCLTETPDLSDVLRKPLAKNKKSSVDPLQMSAAMIKKHAANMNLLPLDAGIGIDQFSKLFLRPDTAVPSSAGGEVSKNGSSKAVAFDMTSQEQWGGDYDDDDDGGGAGFAMNNDGDSVDENQDFCIRELDDVRRVEKVRVGYATVAKQVDVKRLKRDLWKELEDRFSAMVADDSDDDDAMVEDNVVEPVSFQEAVRELEQRKTQPDATLSFYFISILHLANEKGLRLESQGLDDFTIYQDVGVSVDSI